MSLNYKIAAPLEKFKIKTGSDTRNFKIQKTEDKVILRFDEESQLFYARIVNPSQHTRYLFQQGRLAIALCKLNTGKSQRRHMGDKYWPGDRYWDDEEQEWKQVTDFYVKKKYHPRWSRCNDNFTPVLDLDNEIRISWNDDRDLKPNEKHTLGYEHENWFTAIKALLLSCTRNAYEIEHNSQYIYASRGYKTMSNRIKIKYDSNLGHVLEREETASGDSWNDYYHLDARVINQNNREFTIQIDSMGSEVQSSFEKGNLYVGIEFRDAGNYSHRGVYAKANRYGDKDRYAGHPQNNLDRAKRNERYKNRVASKMICPYENKIRINSLTFSYEIDQHPDDGCSALNRLLRIRKNHGDDMTVTRTATLVIGRVETTTTNLTNASLAWSGMTLWRYTTNVEITWNSLLNG